ncbi:MAG: nucleotidyltransferase family protein [Synergistaceae bacterium]|nr:nucleotidyltransferase family protein [Synergistaceae bacterium]
MQVQEQVIYLAGCAVNKETPDVNKISDIEGIYKFAKSHMIASIIASALDYAGIKHELFTQARGQALKKLALLGINSEKVFTRLEDAGIWYMPLKGSVLKSFYPAFGMREMSDVDVLINPSRADDVREIMLQLDFTVEEFGTGHHDVYFKRPVSNFEMHRKLFSSMEGEKLCKYYAGIREKLLPDDGKNYAYHFSPEDLYLYMTAHEFKHYSGGGTGLRSLLDVYVFMKKFADKLDFDYVARELEKLGISDFEANNRTLALNLFGSHELADANKNMLNYILSSGTYGNIINSVNNELAKVNGSRAKYIWRKIFPPINKIHALYPLTVKHKALIPLVIVHRLFKAITTSRKKVINEIKILMNTK